MAIGKVVVNTGELKSAMTGLVEAAMAEIEGAVMSLADRVAETTKATWYTQVRRRSGSTGGSIGTGLRVSRDKIKGVVLSTDKRTFVVYRPRSLSGRWKAVKDSAEFARVASYYRKNGREPEGYKFEVSKAEGLYNMRKWEWNTLRADGKNLWNELVNKDGTAFIKEHADEINAALERAVRIVKMG